MSRPASPDSNHINPLVDPRHRAARRHALRGRLAGRRRPEAHPEAGRAGRRRGRDLRLGAGLWCGRRPRDEAGGRLARRPGPWSRREVCSGRRVLPPGGGQRRAERGVRRHGRPRPEREVRPRERDRRPRRCVRSGPLVPREMTADLGRRVAERPGEPRMPRRELGPAVSSRHPLCVGLQQIVEQHLCSCRVRRVRNH